MKFIDETGGARIGYKNASWPFARLSVNKKELLLKVKLIGEYSFSADDIEELEVLKIIPVLGKGIRIHHNKTAYPKKIIFWTLSDPAYIVNTIKQSGFLASNS